MTSCLRLLAAVVTASLLSSSTAFALPITIQSGYVRFAGSFPVGQADLVGTDGFSFAGRISPFVNIGPYLACYPFCRAGVESVTLASIMLGSDVVGAATIDGLGFGVGSASGIERGNVYFEFSGTAAIPVAVAPGAVFSVTNPFHLRGLLSLPTNLNPTGATPSYELSGDGYATLTMAAGTGFDGSPRWVFSEVEYRFAAVPEPSTVVLVILGGGAMSLRRRL